MFKVLARRPEFYPPVRGEIVGAYKDYSYPVGHAWRDGVLPDGVDHENNGRVGIWLRNCCLPGGNGQSGVTGYIPRGYYSFGFSTKAVMYKLRVISDGAEFGSIIHQIGRASDFTYPTATVTLSGGAISGNPAVTGNGSRYFTPPEIVVQGAGGGNWLTGTRVHAVMEVSAVDTLSGPGVRHKAGDVLTFGIGDGLTDANNIKYTVSTADAGGGILTGSITQRGQTTDPTSDVSLYGNRYEQMSTTGSGTGAHIIFDFRVKSIVTDAAGSGGPASADVLFRPAQLVECNFEGTWYTYGRHGVQDVKNSSVQRLTMRNNSTKNLQGVGNPGGHWDDCDGYTFEKIVVEGTVQGTSPDNSGGSALSIDSSSKFICRRVEGGQIIINSAAWHGLALQADLKARSIRVLSFGSDASRTAANEFGSDAINTGAKGFQWSRGNLECDHLTIAQNEETIGTGAEYHLLCGGTGLTMQSGTDVPGDVWTNSKNNLNDTHGQKSWIGQLTLLNVCRKGVAFVDRNNNETTQPVNIKINSMQVRLSASIAMTAGYQMVNVNQNKAVGGSLQYTEFDCDHAQFFTHSTGSRTDANFADGFFSDTLTSIRFGKVHFPLHGSGTLMEIKGKHDVHAVCDQTNNLGLLTSSTSSLFKITGGTGTAGSRIVIDADSGANHMVQQIALLTTTTDQTVTVIGNNYRNKKLVQFDGNHTRLKVKDCALTGLSGSEDGFYFNGGTFTDCLFMGNVITACGGIGANDNGSTWSNCNGLANRLFSNGTNSNVPGGSIVDRGGSSTLST